MKLFSKPRIKICCISSINEAKLAIEYGASALGFVTEMPSGPGVISESLIIEIVREIPPPIATFMLTSKTDVKEIILQQRRCRTNTIQLVDKIEYDKYNELYDALPGISIVQVIHVTGEESIEEALHISSEVDAILLDSGNPNLAVKELGGTGRIHNWSISRKIREAISVPIFLAGGLNPENVIAAIREVGPFGLDVCSGVRTNGKLDGDKLGHFFTEVNKCEF